MAQEEKQSLASSGPNITILILQGIEQYFATILHLPHEKQTVGKVSIQGLLKRRAESPSDNSLHYSPVPATTTS